MDDLKKIRKRILIGFGVLFLLIIILAILVVNEPSNRKLINSTAGVISSSLQQSSQSPSTGSGNTQVTDVQETGTSKCKLNGYLPDPTCGSGSIDPRVTQDNINSTICVSGYTKTVRPSVDYTNGLKIQGIKDYGYVDTDLSDYEEDHIIPLEVGGNPTEPQNLFPEPIQQAKEKDKVENYLHAQVCNGFMTLSEAQKEIIMDWHAVYVNAGLD